MNSQVEFKDVRVIGGEGRVSISVRSQGPFGGVTLNLGGPTGTLATMDRMGFGMGPGTRNTSGTAPGSFENGRRYDVKIDVAGPHAQVFIDGKPATDVANSYREVTLSPMEAGASLSESTGEDIIKVVNFSEQPRTASIRLEGVPKIASQGTESVLSSASLEEQNSVEQPRKVAVVTRNISGFSWEFTRRFAPCSLTTLCLKKS
jgi:alpha-N-arabinofuranosidase